LLTAEDGLNVTGAPVTVGTAAARQFLQMNMGPIWLGTDTVSHGLVYAGGGAKNPSGFIPFAPSPAPNPDGPVLHGYGGGGLGTTGGGSKYALTWDAVQNVTVYGGLVGTSLILSKGIIATGGAAFGASVKVSGNLDVGNINAQEIQTNMSPIWLGTDTVSHGLVYAGGGANNPSGFTPFAPSPTPNPDGPVLHGYGGGGLGTTNGGHKYALTWDNNQKVTTFGAFLAAGGLTAVSATVIGKLTALSAEVNGNLLVDGDIILSNADCAEEFDVVADIEAEPGTVMVIGEREALRPCSQPYDRRVAGVVSGAGAYKPALLLDRRASSHKRSPVALVGKVYCKFDAQYGAIEVGDLLTTSPTPGHAMKAGDPARAFGAVLGKALQPLASGTGLIAILVALQ
jgi:hypothetical protein